MAWESVSLDPPILNPQLPWVRSPVRRSPFIIMAPGTTKQSAGVPSSTARCVALRLHRRARAASHLCSCSTLCRLVISRRSLSFVGRSSVVRRLLTSVIGRQVPGPTSWRLEWILDNAIIGRHGEAMGRAPQHHQSGPLLARAMRWVSGDRSETQAPAGPQNGVSSKPASS